MAPHRRSRSRESQYSRQSGSLQITSRGLVAHKKKNPRAKEARPRAREIQLVEAVPRHSRRRSRSVSSREEDEEEEEEVEEKEQIETLAYKGPSHTHRSSSTSSSSSVSPFSSPHRHPHDPPAPVETGGPRLRKKKSILMSADRGRPSRRRRSPSPTPSALEPSHDPIIEAIRARQKSRGRVFEDAMIDTPAPETPALGELSSRKRDVILRHERGIHRFEEDSASSHSRHIPVGSIAVLDEEHGSRHGRKARYEPVHLAERQTAIRKEHYHPFRDDGLTDVGSDAGSVIDVLEARSVPFRPRRRDDHDDDDAMSDLFSEVSIRSDRNDRRAGDRSDRAASWKRVNGVAEVLEDSRRPAAYHGSPSGRNDPPLVTKREYRPDLTRFMPTPAARESHVKEMGRDGGRTLYKVR